MTSFLVTKTMTMEQVLDITRQAFAVIAQDAHFVAKAGASSSSSHISISNHNGSAGIGSAVFGGNSGATGVACMVFGSGTATGLGCISVGGKAVGAGAIQAEEGVTAEVSSLLTKFVYAVQTAYMQRDARLLQLPKQ